MRLMHPFEPIVKQDARLLMLGMFPSVGSVQGGGYYGYVKGRSANDFWRLMADVLAAPRLIGLHSDWADRYETLRANRIALWDVVKKCDRDGPSSDSKIRNVKANEIIGLVHSLPHLLSIIFTGKAAHRVFLRHVAPHMTEKDNSWSIPTDSPEVLRWLGISSVPSPSRRNTMPYTKKLRAFRKAMLPMIMEIP